MNADKNWSQWILDPVHSRVRFEARYLMMTALGGWFTDIYGIMLEGKNGNHKRVVSIDIYTQSLYTGNEERDHHLRSADFFNAAQYPCIRFQSKSIVVKSPHQWQVVGDLEIKNQKKQIFFEIRPTGIQKDPHGNLKSGFEATIPLNRKDFALDWNQQYEIGGILISDDVNIFLDLQFLKYEASLHGPAQGNER
jgi:polyisoprenoid-binding protein YceI